METCNRIDETSETRQITEHIKNNNCTTLMYNNNTQYDNNPQKEIIP